MTLNDDAWQHLLHQVDVNPTEKRKEAAGRLLRIVADQLIRGEPVPPAVREWLASTLVAGVTDNAGCDRLVFITRKGNPGAPDREATAFAHMYALMQWGRTQEQAAESVRAIVDAPESEDASNTTKRSNRARAKWTAEGPYLYARSDAEPAEATEEQLRQGRRVVVELSGPGMLRKKTIFLDPRIITKPAY